MSIYFRKHMRHFCIRLSVYYFLFCFISRERIYAGVKAIHRPKLMQELQRSFFAYTLYSRNIIGRISHKRLQIDYLRRR